MPIAVALQGSVGDEAAAAAEAAPVHTTASSDVAHRGGSMPPPLPAPNKRLRAALDPETWSDFHLLSSERVSERRGCCARHWPRRARRKWHAMHVEVRAPPLASGAARPYTLVSPPTSRDELELVVKGCHATSTGTSLSAALLSLSKGARVQMRPFGAPDVSWRRRRLQ